jgi:hypothetical protein
LAKSALMALKFGSSLSSALSWRTSSVALTIKNATGRFPVHAAYTIAVVTSDIRGQKVDPEPRASKIMWHQEAGWF